MPPSHARAWASEGKSGLPTYTIKPIDGRFKCRLSACSSGGSVLAGEVPPAKNKLVQAWVEIHRQELLADWELAVSGEAPFSLDPLR
jgi:hypothetical protein